MVDERLKVDFARDIVLMKFVGLHPVIVHGGGPQIGAVLDQMGIGSRFVNGLRVTDEPTMDVVEMVLGGKVNKGIVAQINQHGGKAVGLSGKDGNLILAEKLKLVHSYGEESPPEIIDIGMVGEVVVINPEIINILVGKGFIPVIAPVGVGANGETYNINADWVASKIAVAVKATRLILLTDTEGIKDGSGDFISSVSTKVVERMLKENVVSGGMIPKVQCSIEALEKGVEKVHIIDGRKPHALLLELFTDKGVGTEIRL